MTGYLITPTIYESCKSDKIDKLSSNYLLFVLDLRLLITPLVSSNFFLFSVNFSNPVSLHCEILLAKDGKLHL
jgi:hypothetical protein